MAVKKNKKQLSIFNKKISKRMQKKLVMLFMAVILAFVVLIAKLHISMLPKEANLQKLFWISRHMTAG